MIGGKIVYLDRNIFADLYRGRGDVSAEDVERLRTLVEANDVLIPLSHTLGISEATLRRAKRALGTVRVQKVGMRAGWVWMIDEGTLWG